MVNTHLLPCSSLGRGPGPPRPESGSRHVGPLPQAGAQEGLVTLGKNQHALCSEGAATWLASPAAGQDPTIPLKVHAAHFRSPCPSQTSKTSPIGPRETLSMSHPPRGAGLRWRKAAAPSQCPRGEWERGRPQAGAGRRGQDGGERSEGDELIGIDGRVAGGNATGKTGR